MPDCFYTLNSGIPMNQGRAIVGVTPKSSGQRWDPPFYGNVFRTKIEQLDAKYTDRFDDKTYYSA
jgi:hypothetical protein